MFVQFATLLNLDLAVMNKYVLLNNLSIEKIKKINALYVTAAAKILFKDFVTNACMESY